MKLEINGLRMWKTSVAAWIWLSLSLPTYAAFSNSELSFGRVPKTSVAHTDFSAPFRLDARQDRMIFQIIFAYEYLSETPVLTSRVDQIHFPHSKPRPLRISFSDEKFQVSFVTISRRGQSLLSLQDSRFFQNSFLDHSFRNPSFSITPIDPSFMVRTSECFRQGLSLGGCGQ